jgi:hypothetical protein
MAALAQRVIKMLCPKWQTSIEQESRDWAMRCPCGYETSIWEMGGIRYKAAGNPVRSGRCAKCGNVFMGQVYRRSRVGDLPPSETLSDSSTLLPLKTEGEASKHHSESASPAKLIDSCLLWIDGVGCYQIVSRDRVSIGSHTTDRAGADIRLLAPLNRQQAVVARSGEGYYLETEDSTARTGDHKGGRLLRSGDTIEIGGGVRLRLRMPNSLSQTAVLEFVSPHRPVKRVDGVVLLEQVCILGPAEDAHIRCTHWQNPLVLFQRHGELWCKGASGMTLNGESKHGEFALTDGAVVTGDDLRLRVELSCD